MAIKVFIYDDSSARRDSLKAFLEMSDDINYVGEAAHCLNVAEDISKTFPDVVLMDLNMPEADGIYGLQYIKKNHPHIKVLIQTVFDDSEKIFESIRNGSSGYILKKDSPLRLLEAIKEVYEGGAVMNPSIALKVLNYFKSNKDTHTLTEREIQVLQLLAEGNSYKMVANQLGISYHTVNTYTKKIYEKLHVSSLGEAISIYYKNLNR
jgi:DNA-binding NarL/FixJ family response regulator